MEQSTWLEEMMTPEEEWSTAMRAPGTLFVLMAGRTVNLRQELSVTVWATVD